MEDSSEDDHASSGLVIPSSGSVSSSPGNSNTKCPPSRPSLNGTGGSVSSRNSQRRSTRSGRWDEISETDSGWSDVYRDDDDDSLEDFDNASNSLHGNHTNHSLDLERIEEDNVVLHVRMKKQASNTNRSSTKDCRDDEYDSEDEFWNSSGDWDGNDTTTESGSAAPPNATSQIELQMEQDNNTLVLEHAQNTAQLNGMSQMMESSDVTRSPDSPTKRASATINSVNGNRRRFSSSQNGSNQDDDNKSEATRQPKNGLSLPLQASPPTKSNRVPPSQRRMSTNKQPSVSTLSSEKPDQPGQRHNLSVPLGLDPEAEDEEEDEEADLNDNDDNNYWDDSEEESDGGWDDVDDSDSNWDDDEEDEADWDEEIFKEYDEEKRKALIKQRSSKRALQKRMSSRKKLQKRLPSRKALQKQGSSKKRISNTNAAIATTTVDGDEPQQQQQDDTLAADSISTLTEDLTALDSRASNDSTPQPAAPKPPQFPKQEKRQSFRNINNNKQRQSFPKQHSRQRIPKQPSRQSFRNNQPNQPSRTLVAPRPPEEQRPPPSSGAASVSTSRSSRSKPRTPEDWEQLMKTWEKIERKNKKKANGSRRTSSKNTAQTQPIIEEEGEAMADDSSKQQQQNGKKSCFGEHVFPFKFLSKKKKGR